MRSACEEVHRELERFFEEHKEEELKGLFCVVEPGRHRIRRLPRSERGCLPRSEIPNPKCV